MAIVYPYTLYILYAKYGLYVLLPLTGVGINQVLFSSTRYYVYILYYIVYSNPRSM